MDKLAIANIFLDGFLTIVILFLTLLVVFYVKNIVHISVILKNKWIKIAASILIGCLYSIFSLFFIFINKSIFSSSSTSSMAPAIFNASSYGINCFLNPFASLAFSFTNSCIWIIRYFCFTKSNFAWPVLYTTLAFASFTLLFYFIKNKYTKYVTPFASTFVITIVSIAIPFIRITNEVYVLISCIFIFSWLYYFVGKILNNFFNKTANIRENITYNNKYFVNHAFSKAAFYGFITTNKIEFGYFVMLNFENKETKIVQWIANEINNRFKNLNILYLTTKSNKFCFFIPRTDASLDANLVREKLEGIHTASLKHNNTDVQFLVSQYGTNSNVLDELILFCETCDILKIKNGVQFFDKAKLNTFYNTKNRIRHLWDAIPIDRINIKFKIEKINGVEFCLPKIRYPIEMNRHYLAKKFLQDYSMVERIVSNKILYSFIYSKYLSDTILVLPYSKSFINSADFDYKKFTSIFINNFGRENLEKIVLVFSRINPSTDKLLIKNLQALRHNHIKVGVFQKPTPSVIPIFDYFFDSIRI